MNNKIEVRRICSIKGHIDYDFTTKLNPTFNQETKKTIKMTNQKLSFAVMALLTVHKVQAAIAENGLWTDNDWYD